MLPNTESLDVIIIGAGMAGVRTATLLHDAGLRVGVLEARQRPGGRLHSVPVGGVMVDAGGQWVGPAQKRVLTLAKQHGLTLIPTWYRGANLFGTPNQPARWRWVPPLGLRALYGLVKAMRAFDRAAAGINIDAPWLSADAARLDSLSLRDWFAAGGLDETAMQFLDCQLSALFCRPITEISALEAQHQLATIGNFRTLESAEKWFMAEGAQTLVERMAAPIRDRVRFGSAVQQATQTDEGVTVVDQQHTWQARWAVFATPPACTNAIGVDGTDSAGASAFAPSTQTGDVIKVIAVYPKPWWRTRGLSGLCVSTSGPFQLTIDSSPADGGVGVLVGLASARGAETARTSGVPLGQLFEDHIRSWFGAAQVPAPLGVYATDWTIDPLSRGGYAARRGIGSWVGAPFPNGRRDGRFFYAGTETATAWRSNMEGALESAERVAGEVIAAHGAERLR